MTLLFLLSNVLLYINNNLVIFNTLYDQFLSLLKDRCKYKT